MQISFRQAHLQDSAYCAGLYFAEMEVTVRESIDTAPRVANFRQRWEVAQVRIITLDSADIGWFQATTEGYALFLAQLFVDVPFRRRGIGAEVLHRIIDEAGGAGRGVRLGVVKANPALRLYKRLGFQIIHEDERKFYMTREPDAAASISN